MAEKMRSQDDRYLKIILSRLEVCKEYKPKFGRGEEVTFEDFQKLYRSDLFYSWLGLDNPLVYAAHKASGGITSVYRQIGTGCEYLFRQLLRDHLGLSAQQATWSYEIRKSGGNKQRLSLDGRIELDNITAKDKKDRISKWLRQAANQLSVAPEIVDVLKGVVFEVRQGYKSKDSKRQNADIANIATAYTQAYLPVLLLFSAQIDGDVAARYESVKCLVLRGDTDPSPVISSYAFCKEVLGYDLAAFFKRNSKTLKKAVDDVLKTLLKPEDE